MRLDLRHFVRRAKVLQLYRQLLRQSAKLRSREDGLADDVRSQITTQFRVNASETEAPTISVLIRDAERHLDTLRSLTGDLPLSAAQADGSWKGTVNPDGSDERGRVGEDWPWARK